MRKQILFVQGGGKGAHDEWDNKLVASLECNLGPGYQVQYPRMPNEADPVYADWKAALTAAIAALGDGGIVVSHSIGAAILINALADEPGDRKLAGIFLIAAPFVGPGGWLSDGVMGNADLRARLPRRMPIFLYHGSLDETAPPAHVDLYEKAIPWATVRRLSGRDHQLANDLSEVAKDIRALA